MKRFILWLAGGVVILTLVGLLSLHFYTQTADFRTWARDQILSLLRSSVNGEVTIEGISSSWWTSITFHNIVIRQNGLDALFIPEGTVTYDLFPQLRSFYQSSSLHISSLTLSAPTFHLRQEAQAGWNISQLFKTSEQPSGSSSQVSIFLDHIGITDGQLNIQPADTPSTHLTGLSLAGNLAVRPNGTQIEFKTLSFDLAREGLP